MTGGYWRLRHRVLQWKDRPLLMGILNATPDSFSDGGRYLDPDAAIQRGREMWDGGAQIIDVGGESTRPGAEPIDAAEQIRRVIPVIEGLHALRPDGVISVDTYLAEVAEKAIAAGAQIINDISGGRWDQQIIEVAIENAAGYVCMHASERPQRMQQYTTYQNVVREVSAFLQERRASLVKRGMSEERLVFDPGIGFGKEPDHNISLLRQVDAWQSVDRPILWGVSRKSFLTRSTGGSPSSRDLLDATVHQFLARQPYPQIWRVHDPEAIQAMFRLNELLRGE